MSLPIDALAKRTLSKIDESIEIVLDLTDEIPESEIDHVSNILSTAGGNKAQVQRHAVQLLRLARHYKDTYATDDTAYLRDALDEATGMRPPADGEAGR